MTNRYKHNGDIEPEDINPPHWKDSELVERWYGWRLVAAWVFILGICAAFYYGTYKLLVWVFS